MGIEEYVIEAYREDGLKKGIEKGREEGRQEGRQELSAKQRDFTLRLWQMQMFSFAKIADLVGIPEEEVTGTVRSFLMEQGHAEAEAQQSVEAYRQKLGA